MKQEKNEGISEYENPKTLEEIEGKIDDKEIQEEQDGAEQLTEDINHQIENILSENEEAQKLLSSEEIDDDVRAEFGKELSELKQETLSLQQRLYDNLITFGEDAVKLVKNIGWNIKMIVREIPEIVMSPLKRKSSIKKIDLIFDKLKFENDDLRRDWVEEKSKEYSTIPSCDFPLNEEGIIILKSMMKKEPSSLYDLEKLIENTNGAFHIIEKGVSLETARKIDSHFLRGNSLSKIIESPEEIEKLIALDKTDLKESDTSISLSDLKDITLEQIKLLSESPDINFSFKNYPIYGLKNLASFLTEENITKLKAFDENITSITLGEFKTFVEEISDLPEEIQKMCKEVYDRNGKKEIYNVIYDNHDLLKGFDQRNIDKFKVLVDKGVLRFPLTYGDEDTKKYLSLDESIFERYRLIGQEEIKYMGIDSLLEIDRLSDEEFDLLKEISQLNKESLEDNMEYFKKINSRLGNDDGKLFLEWMKKSDVSSYNFKGYVNDNYLEQFKTISEFKKTEPDVNLFDLVSKAYGPSELSNAVYNQSTFFNVATNLEQSPELIIPHILDNEDGISNTFLNFSDIKEILAKKNIHFSEEDSENLLNNLIDKPRLSFFGHGASTPFLIPNTFPFSIEQRKKVLEFLIDNKPDDVVSNYSFFEKEYLQYSDNKEESLNQLFERWLKNYNRNLLKPNDFPFSVEQRKKVLEFLIDKDPNGAVSNYSFFEKEYLQYSDNKEESLNQLFERWLGSYNPNFLKPIDFPFSIEQRKKVLEFLIDNKPRDAVLNYSLFEKEYLQYSDNKEESLNQLFKKCLENDALIFLINSKDFPFTPEQKRYLSIFEKIQNSDSRELKNLYAEIIPLVAKYTNAEDANKAFNEIEQIFLTNNIPLVGKQYKVFEILYPNKKLSNSVEIGKVESLKTLHNSLERKLTIFKDLMRSHIASADSNLEQYLLTLKDGKEALEKLETDSILNDTDKASLKFFLRRMNSLSGNIGREDIEIGEDTSDEEIKLEIQNLNKALGVREGESMINKFERTFLKRINIDTIDDALDIIEKYRSETTSRNEKGAETGIIEIEEGDYVKNVQSDFLRNYLGQGIYAPEFIGAESNNAKEKSKSSDATPLDTDISRVDTGKNISDVFNPDYGDIMFVIKQKEQLERDGLDIFKTGYIGDSHYGIRTGFGSTEIDAIYVPDYENQSKKTDQLKFFIAEKGFYIPICNSLGEVKFTKEDYDKQREVFAGIDRFHGDDIKISDAWKSDEISSEIQEVSQTFENIDKITDIRDSVMSKIELILEEEGINIHEGKYDNKLRGAIISDTGSTGRGSSLDEKFDFDFAVKLDDSDLNKIPNLIKKIDEIFPKEDQYENRGMIMFRSKEVEINGSSMTIDIGFNGKNNYEEFDSHEALKEKYESIHKNEGGQVYLDTLSNVRFAKKKLKEANCYKKGSSEDQQGGIGGIGVEYWILQNKGDALEAFKNFKEHSFKDGEIVPFIDFKKNYKVFSAGQNIRGSVKVENFIDNMTNEGYEKMANLAKEIIK